MPRKRDRLRKAPHALLIDDDALVLESLSIQLRSAGWTVTTAGDLASARASLLEDPEITVILCDVHLSQESGFQMAEELKELRGEIDATEIVFITGEATRDSAMTALRHRAFDLLPKPLSIKDLRARALAAHRSASRRRNRQQMLDALERRAEVGKQLKRRLSKSRHSVGEDSLTWAVTHGGIQEEFLNVLSHELKTPLIPVIGLAELMLHPEGLTTEDIEESARFILEGGERINSIVERVLIYIGSEHRFLKSAKQAVSIRESIDAALQSLDDQITSHETRFAVACPEEMRAWGVEAQITQALVEVLENAVKAAGPGGSVGIRGKNPGTGVVVVDVADNGCGLPKVVQECFGHPFTQGDMGLSRQWQGLGMGLAIARKLSRLNGGDIEFKEPVAASGTLIRFTFRDAGVTAG